MTPASRVEPLADLHRHLDGSLRPETIQELAARAGVRACLCTDNTLLSAVTSSEEHRRALHQIPGMTEEKLRLAIAAGHAGAFIAPRRPRPSDRRDIQQA